MWPFKKISVLKKSKSLSVPYSGKQLCFYEYKERDMNRLYVEFSLKRKWFENKDKSEIFSFKPINIRTEKNPCFIDAIKYDVSALSTESINAFLSTASDDHLLLRPTINNQHHKFVDAPCYRTSELSKLLFELENAYKSPYIEQ